MALPFQVGQRVTVPACLSKVETFDRNPVKQVLVRAQEGTIRGRARRPLIELDAGPTVRVTGRKPQLDDDERVFVVAQSSARAEPRDATPQQLAGRWVGEVSRSSPDDVRQSWVGAFQYREQDLSAGIVGLRSPQIGAVHAVLGYWTTGDTEPATVVMPTGTGKTETMLSLSTAGVLTRLLVLVPSDALRTQIAAKFESLGVLHDAGVLEPAARHPVVGQVRHSFTSTDRAVSFAQQCNVVVATPAAVDASDPDVRLHFLEEFTHLFVDEAHHVAARTWRRIRDDFTGRPVVQFTATPFREDGRHLGGRLLYAYPLREAQRTGLFAPIDFISVLDLGNHDVAIAERAVHRLREDLQAGHDHLLMARTSRIGRARELLPVYEHLAPDLNPVVLHSRDRKRDQQAAVAAMHNRTSRVIVCVDMLGEGFDLPELKIAAVHDPHKSLSVTLQFVGRFARTGSDLGRAAVIVGRPSGQIDPTLRRLYAEDADWNAVIDDLSTGVIGQQADISQFEAAFGQLPENVAMRNLAPKMSTVVYRTPTATWDPHQVTDLYDEDSLLTYPIAVNHRDSVAWFVLEQQRPVTWGEIETFQETVYDLYVLYWDREHRLLYVNSSNTDSLHQDLAEIVAGSECERIAGETVYRTMAHLARPVPTNVGVLDIRNRSRRFSFHVGADVTEGFPISEAQTKTQTNIFVYGYEDGQRVSIGASLKGRIWSHQVAPTVKHWVDWCDHIGAKLLDDGLDVDEVMHDFVRPETLDERPSLVPLALEWTWEILSSPSQNQRISFGSASDPIVDIGFELRNHERTGPIAFRVTGSAWSADYELKIYEGTMHFRPQGAEPHFITPRTQTPLSAVLNETGLYIHLEGEALVVPPATLLRPQRDISPFDRDLLTPIDWTGVDLTIESQASTQRDDSIQGRMAAYLLESDSWDFVVDDDGPGEIADLVAMRDDGETLHVYFVHCKWVAGGQPRAQVADLYEVCGQAQKSANWRRNPTAMIDRIRSREQARLNRGQSSRLLFGDAARLYQLEDAARLRRCRMTVAIAQPGVSAARVSQPQLELLASTQTYLLETANADLDVFCSP